MRKRPFVALIPVALSLVAVGCGTDPEAKRAKLEITASPVQIPFSVGDTSGLWNASRTVIDATGKSVTDGNYVSFHLVSDDTTVVGVVNGRFVTGRKPGSANVTAKDDKSDLVSESSVTVTVTAAP